MKLKRFLALAVSLTMVLSFVPAFSFTASAAAPTYNPETLIDLEGNFSWVADNIANGSGWGAVAWDNSNVKGTSWEGWSGDRNLFKVATNTTIIDAGGTGNTVKYLYANDTVKTGTANKEFLVVTWEVDGSWEDFGMLNADGTIFDTFRLRAGNAEGLNYYWAYGTDTYKATWAGQYGWDSYEDNASAGDGITTARARYYMVYTNTDGGGYTASYYYSGPGIGSVTTWIGTKTYNSGSILGFSGIAMNTPDNGWARMHDLNIYAGTLPKTVFPVTATYTVNGETVETKTGSYNTANGETGVNFDAYYYSANGSNVMYKADAITGATEDQTIEMTAVTNTSIYSKNESITIDDNEYVVATGVNLIPNSDFSYGLVGWYGGDNSAASSANFSVSNNVLTQKTSTYSYKAESIYRAWAIEAGKTYVMKWTMGAASGNAYIKTQTSATRETGVLTTLCDTMTAGVNDFVFTADETATYVSFNAGWYASTFSDFGLYEVEPQYDAYYVTVTGAGSNNYSNKEVGAFAVDEVPIPYFEGYVLADRTVSGQYITYTYEATEASLGSWAIRNNVTNDSYPTQMKFLGSHNSFANKSSAVVNEGGALNGVDFASSTGSTVVSQSQTQELTALEQLNAGVRYFDIRLTRQNDGTFWTFHGPAFSEFLPIAHTIAQFAKENPGEIILLDFHTTVDALYTSPIGSSATDSYNGDKAGDDNAEVYAVLSKLLEDAGIMEYVPAAGNGANGAPNWDQNYGTLTNYGEKTSILLIGKARFANNNDRVINRSNKTSGDATYVDSGSYDDTEGFLGIGAETGVSDNIDDTYNNIRGGDNFGIIHAYLTPLSDLLDAAAGCNDDWINEANFAAWMGRDKGDILLMNGITKEVAETYLARLSQYNRDGFDEYYGNEKEEPDYVNGYAVNGVTLTGANTILPYSTEFKATVSTPATATYTIDGVEYTSINDYTLEFLQFDTTGVSAADGTTFTFATDGDESKIYSIIYEGSVLASSEAGASSVSVTSGCASGTKVTLVSSEAPYVEITVNYMYNGEVVGTDIVKDFGDADTSLTVAAGVYAKQYYIDSAVEATVTNYECSVEVKPLTLFTWEASSNSALQTNGTYNAGRVVYWGSGSGNRTGYAYATVPAVTEDQTLFMTLDVVFNNDFRSGQVPHAVFSTVDRASLEAIDLAGGSATTTALANLTSTEFKSFNMFDTSTLVGGAVTDNKYATVRVPVTGLNEGDIAVKMVDNGSQSGVAVINSLTFEIGYTVNVDDTTSYVIEGNSITVKPADSAVALSDGTGSLYAGEKTIVPTKNMDLYSVGLGATMVEGAQVRIGDGVDGDGKVSDGSGLRFIALVDTADSLAYEVYENYYTAGTDSESGKFDEGFDIGVMITAEDSTAAAVKISATKWQDAYAYEGTMIYTSALTNLAETNYNRKFTAVPYVTVNGEDIVGTTSSIRSIYQVAAGLLTTANTDGTSYDDTALKSEILYKVLNAYVNQTGIRLALIDADSNLIAHETVDTNTSTKGGKYTGDAFFTVEAISNADGVYKVKLTPVGNAKILTNEIAKTGEGEEGTEAFWKQYIRINNNNGYVKTVVDLADNGDGTYTLTFTHGN